MAKHFEEQAIKFLFVNTDYPAFIDWLYAAHPGLAWRSFDEQMQARRASLFGMLGFYSGNLQKLGHEAWDVVCDNEVAQKQWAGEHGRTAIYAALWGVRLRRGIVPWVYRHRRTRWQTLILAEQVKAYKPDVLYSMAIGITDSAFLRSVKGYYRLAVGQHASPLPNCDFSEFDLILSSLPNQVQHFRRHGMRSTLLRLAFEPGVLQHLSPGARSIDVSFIGGLAGPHRGGTQTLEALCRELDVKVWGYGIEGMPEASPLRRAFQGPLWGKAMFQVLHDSRIAFNRHIDAAEDCASNMRMYEATGAGALLLSEWKTNLPELFEPGTEMVAYRSSAECVALAQYYLDHEAEREAIARAGRQRTLREHTYFQRMQELVDIVRPLL